MGKKPILAAIGAGVPIYEPQGHMIVDIGGGTIDVAVISLGKLYSNSVKCGNCIDAAIIDYVKKSRNLAIGEKTAEDIKITVGSALPLGRRGLTMEIKDVTCCRVCHEQPKLRVMKWCEQLAREMRDD